MTIIAALLLFGVIVFIHELGHFLFAKKAGVRIDEFAIGMGPKLFTIKKGETNYSIRLLPLGGYVSMEGENEESNDPRSFGSKTILQRASILFAGPVFNIIFAAILLIPVFLYTGSASDSNEIGKLVDNSPAKEIGLQVGDKIVEINNIKINSWEGVTTTLQTIQENENVNIKIERDGNIIDYSIIPQKSEQGRFVIGIIPVYEKGIFTSIKSAILTTWEMLRQMLIFLGQLLTGNLPGGIGDSVAGPIGVISIVSDAARTGFINLLYIGSMISLNLGILNLLPIPALDGGRLIFILIEAIRGGKKIDPNKEGMLHTIGFMLLMGFTLFITYKYILRLF